MYKLLDCPENRLQYTKFLEQYSIIGAKENKTNDELYWLELRKYQLEVIWINADNTIIDENPFIDRPSNYNPLAKNLNIDENKVVKGGKKNQNKVKK